MMYIVGLIICLLVIFIAWVLNPWVTNRISARQQPPAQEEAITETDSTGDSHVSVTLLDQDVLECPICCEPLKIPIYQCTNGHVACSSCRVKVKNLCPSCQSPIGNDSRCRAMERVMEAIRVSCPNAKHGCEVLVSYGNPSIHEKKCVFAPCSCPVRECNYNGLHKDLKNHVNVEHKEGVSLFTWDTPLIIETRRNENIEKITILREEKDEELIVVRCLRGPDGMAVHVSYIAPLATEMGRLSCDIELRTSRRTLMQRLRLKAFHSELHPDDDVFVFSEENGFMRLKQKLIPSCMLRRRFILKICISRGLDHIARTT
ncbi:unnamed protein product [Microthlaspi erraticum]|uniref:RING-type E3 ubiquitin transferase n=1 Tax=Microthlaspi erraticum TaxID=1685480 RepID=A0A6D2KMC5_9BRAS|nr:unnamed protein product [Microthlaspi erraticum]